MTLFHPENRNKSEAHAKLYALTELAYTAVDFTAALLFVIGSFLFFNDATTYAGTWLFVVGSVLFGARPAIRLYRELRYLKMGDWEDIAKSK